MLDELREPVVVNGIEETTNVRIEQPVHISAHDPDVKRVQRMVWTAPWSKSIRESEKVLLAHRLRSSRRPQRAGRPYPPASGFREAAGLRLSW